MGAVEFDLGDDAFVDGSGEHVSAVIVGVFAYEVDAPCGRELGAALSEEGNELFVDFVFHFMVVLVFTGLHLQI